MGAPERTRGHGPNCLRKKASRLEKPACSRSSWIGSWHRPRAALASLRVRSVLCVALLAVASCARERNAAGTAAPASRDPAAEVHAAPARPDPIRMEVLNPGETPPTFVLRGEPRGKARLVFLH